MLAEILLLGCSQSESATAVPNPTTSVPRVSDSATNTDVWKPTQRTSWQWQLNDLPIDSSFDIAMYDIDLFVICYMNAGGWENWRPPAAKFPEEIIGKNLDGWEGER